LGQRWWCDGKSSRPETGPQNPQGPTGLHRFEEAVDLGPSWIDIFDNWGLVEADLHDRFGIDIEDRVLMRSRPWRWLKSRILALFSVPPLIVPAEPPIVIPQTRIGFVLDPPGRE